MDETRLLSLIEDVVTRAINRLEEKLDRRFEGIDKRFEGIERDIREIKGFQKHESDGIEFEIYSTLKNHLKFDKIISLLAFSVSSMVFF